MAGRLPLLLGALLLVVGGCSPYRKPLLAGVYQEVCPGGNPEVATLRFRKDHGFDYAYPRPDAWRTGDDETWKLKGDTLIVSWNDGYAVTRYDLSRGRDGDAPGVSTIDACLETIRLRRVVGR